MLETICFNFTSRMPFPYVIKMCRMVKGEHFSYLGCIHILTSSKASKTLSKFAWRLAIDRYRHPSSMGCREFTPSFSFRTLVNLMFPPHTVAVACIYLAGLLSSFEQEAPASQGGNLRTALQIVEFFKNPGEWESTFKCHVEDLDGEYLSIFSQDDPR